jgi:peptidoglycan-associated lipoprotein
MPNLLPRALAALLLVHAIPTLLNAQPMSGGSAVRTVEAADEAMDEGNYAGALDLYERAYELEKDQDVAYKIANLQYQLRDYAQAESWFSKVLERDERGDYPAARFAYGRVLKMNGKYMEALTQLTRFRSQTNNEAFAALYRAEVDGIKLGADNSYDPLLSISDAGDVFNTASTEFSPVFYSDNVVYFAALHDSGSSKVRSSNDLYAKIYKVSKTGDAWGQAVPLDERINKKGYHTGNVAFSKDGQRMYFTRAVLKGNKLIDSKIYESILSDNVWGEARPVEQVNGAYISKHPCVAEIFGQEVLIFAADRPDSKGGFDLYYAPRLANGQFGEAASLGERINTFGDEITPFFQNGTLYFSSTGQMNIGGFDVFSTKLRSNGWEAPQNMGKPLNSPQDDLYYSLDKSGKKGFIVSNRPSGRSLQSPTCCDNIYLLNIGKNEYVPPRIDLEVAANNAKTGARLVDVAFGLYEKTGDTWKLIKTGQWRSTTLSMPKEYRLTATKKGFEQASLEFDTKVAIDREVISKTLDMQPIAPPPPPPPPPPVVPQPPVEEVVAYINQPIRLNNIYYNYNDDNILPDAEKDLNTLLKLMIQYPDMVIELSSHTDSRGSGSYNLQLSQRRADKAREWLLRHGIAPERVAAVGYGETTLLNACSDDVTCTDAQHQQNRRTEFKIIAGPTVIKMPKQR